jgi:hypothetical protein
VPAANTGVAPTPSPGDPAVAGRRRAAWIAAVVTVSAIAVVLVVTIVTAGRDRDDFDTTSTAQLVQAVKSQGLTVCGSRQSSGAHANDAVTTQVLQLAMPGDCADAIDLQIDAYRSRSARDAAARSAEGVDRGRTAGTVWTWHQYTVYLQGDDASGPTGVRDRVVDALSAVGAS